MVKEDMAGVEVTEEDTVERNNWRRKIRCGEPCWEKPKEEEIYCICSPLIVDLSWHLLLVFCPPVVNVMYYLPFDLHSSLVVCLFCRHILLSSF